MVHAATPIPSVRSTALILAGSILVSAGCAPPPVVPPPGEMDALRSRVDRSRGDLESTVRLAAGLLNEGDVDGAQRLLEDAYEEVPSATAYLAALGAVAESRDDYVTARARYLDFSQRAGWTPLTKSLAERLVFHRGKTAPALARELVEGSRVLDHGTERSVIAVPRVTAPLGDERLERLAIVMTELLVRDLRAQRQQVIDWELSEAVHTLVGQDDLTDGTVARHLAADFIVGLEIAPIGEGFASIDVSIHSFEPGGEWVDSLGVRLSIVPGPYAPERTRIAGEVLELLIDAQGGVNRPPLAPDGVFDTDRVLDLFADGLLAAARGDDASALRDFEEALAYEPGSPPVLDRVRQFQSLTTPAEDRVGSLFTEVLAFARSAAQAQTAARTTGAAWSTPEEMSRSGALDALGLDRLGAHTFVDLIVRLGGGS